MRINNLSRFRATLGHKTTKDPDIIQESRFRASNLIQESRFRETKSSNLIQESRFRETNKSSNLMLYHSHSVLSKTTLQIPVTFAAVHRKNNVRRTSNMAYICSSTIGCRFDIGRRSSMSTRNDMRYRAANRRQLLNPSPPGFQGFRTSWAVNFSADSFQEKTLVLPELIAAQKNLKLNSGSYYLPHPDKKKTGGEDAHFISSDGKAIGVADGVGGWAELGINEGIYAQNLMANLLIAIQDEPTGKINPRQVLEKAYRSTKVRGSSTACIIALTDQGLHAINLGDSGFLVVRDGVTVFRSPAQQHEFNFPYQLESGNGSDLPGSGQVFTVCVKDGDVIIAGTDGLFDNLFDKEIISVIVGSVRARFDPQVTAQKIVALALQRANNSKCLTPFSEAAGDAGLQYQGGKLDDITAVVSYVTINDEDSLSVM